MLNLVASGPKLIYIETAQPQALLQSITDQFPCQPMEQLGVGIDIAKTQCILCVVSNDSHANQPYYLGMAQTAESVLCQLMTSQLQQMITHIRPLPPIILFNSLGEQKPVVDKIQSEFSCRRVHISQLLAQKNARETILCFLTEDKQGSRSFYQDVLLIEQDYLSLLSYLQIHAPRYLAKAFPPNAWHMVDLRIYDRYEAYELQYKRLTEAIKILQLGYLITETWNREISMFSDPIGTYHIRLLTFLEPMELKKRLIALEYSQRGQRIVDLNLIWHKKKISWKDLLDNKAIRKEIKQTAAFFPKSNFFAIQNDKAALIQYCMKQTYQSVSQEEKAQLQRLESAICAKSADNLTI